MSPLVLVEPDCRLSTEPESVDELIGALKEEGLDARRPQEASVIQVDHPEGASLLGASVEAMFAVEAVAIWLASQTAGAVINRVVSDVADWMKKRNKRNRNQFVLREAKIILYEGDRIQAIGIFGQQPDLESVASLLAQEPKAREPKIEWHSADTEPDRWHEFEQYTRIKPPKA